MNIDEISLKKVWDNYFNTFQSPSFLQSWEWGEVQKNLGYDVVKVSISQGNTIHAISQIIKIRSRRGNFLFIPHGPIIYTKIPNINKLNLILKELLQYLIVIAKNERFDFIRIAPILIDSQMNRQIFIDLGCKTAPIYMHAERTWVLDIDKSEEELLQNMRKTTRYMIHRAVRDKVVIEERSDQQALHDFWKIYQETAAREQFIPYSPTYLMNEYEEFHKTGNALFLFGKVEDTILASALIVFTKSSGFYHQGASIHSKFPVPYRMQWEAIKEAKKRGCSLYNFWGIKQKGRTPKDWDGLTMFKTGFGGRQIDFVPTQDYIISPKYYFTFVYEKYLAYKRGV